MPLVIPNNALGFAGSLLALVDQQRQQGGDHDGHQHGDGVDAPVLRLDGEDARQAAHPDAVGHHPGEAADESRTA
jgi:hypothetical protein